MNKNEALFYWLLSCPYITETFSEFCDSEDGNVCLSSSEGQIKAYVDGSSKRYLDFYIIQFKEYNGNVPNDPENAEIMDEVTALMDWVKTQNRERNFPDFPEGCKVLRVEVLQDQPTVSGNDKETAKFMFGCRVVYTQISEV